MRFLSVILTLFCAVISGCGPKIVSVSGTVTMNGQPMKDICVLFQPLGSGKDIVLPSTAITDEMGCYSLIQIETKKKGAVPGTYSIYLSWRDPDALNTQPIEGVTREKTPPVKIPTRASNGSLQFEVPESGTDKADFHFKSKEESFTPSSV